MEIIDNGIVRVLTSKKGYKLYSINTNQYYDKVYLGINDSIENYREILDEDYVDPDLSNRVKELEEMLTALQQKINL